MRDSSSGPVSEVLAIDEKVDEKILAQLRAAGVREGGVLLVHTSYRAVRPVEGGPLGLIRSLKAALGPHGTLVMPTMTDGEAVFDPRSTPTVDMGITAELFWRQPGVVRSTHPGGSFAAWGPHAEQICAPQPLSPPHGPDSPVGRVHDLDGQILLIGVTHGENTTLHLAEAIAEVPYSISHPTVVEVDGRAETVLIAETDHCCRGFVIADEWLGDRGEQQVFQLGNAEARLCSSRQLVAMAVDFLADDPLLFLCDRDEGCQECDAARESAA